jgi:hypothetical protein
MTRSRTKGTIAPIFFVYVQCIVFKYGDKNMLAMENGCEICLLMNLLSNWDYETCLLTAFLSNWSYEACLLFDLLCNWGYETC